MDYSKETSYQAIESSVRSTISSHKLSATFPRSMTCRNIICPDVIAIGNTRRPSRSFEVTYGKGFGGTFITAGFMVAVAVWDKSGRQDARSHVCFSTEQLIELLNGVKQ